MDSTDLPYYIFSVPDKSEIDEILYQFFNNASEEEIKELLTILASRHKSSPLRSLNFQALAHKTAQSIKESLGLSQNFIRDIAQTSIASIIKSYAPDISPQELDILLQHLIPSLKKKEQPHVEPQMLLFMVNQFVAYSLGQLKAEEATALPPNWPQKYWELFPQTIRGLIAKFLKAEIDEELFRQALAEALRRLSQ